MAKSKKNKIYIDQWMDRKPYTNHSQTDLYYLQLCNKLYTAIDGHFPFLLMMQLSKKEISELCCFLVSYFEDIISQTNIWGAFLTKHKELYKEKLPFYSSPEYVDGEINSQ